MSTDPPLLFHNKNVNRGGRQTKKKMGQWKKSKRNLGSRVFNVYLLHSVMCFSYKTVQIGEKKICKRGREREKRVKLGGLKDEED